MGRAKARMELIKSEKSRLATLKTRKIGLKRKIHELSTLCDVKVCMIMYEPRKDGKDVEPEILPTDPNEIKQLFEMYMAQPEEDRAKRTCDLLSFFKDRKEKLEIALMKQRKKNIEAKFPTWDQRYNDFSEERLREFLLTLDSKIEDAKHRLGLLKNYPKLEPSDCYANEFLFQNRTSTSGNDFEGNFGKRSQSLSEVNWVDMNNLNGQEGGYLNANYAMTWLMNNGSYDQLHGLNSSNYMYTPMPMPMPLNGPIYSDIVPGGLLDYMMANNSSVAGPDGDFSLAMKPLTIPQYGESPAMITDQI